MMVAHPAQERANTFASPVQLDAILAPSLVELIISDPGDLRELANRDGFLEQRGSGSINPREGVPERAARACLRPWRIACVLTSTHSAHLPG